MSVEFRAMEYGDGEHSVAAALVTGQSGKIAAAETAALDLVRAGHDVVAYEYEDLFSEGDPQHLPALIHAVHADFEERIQDHPERRFTGTSLGMGIAFNLQKMSDRHARTALLAAGGVDVAENIFRNPVFRALKLHAPFVRNGYDIHSLKAEWHELHEPPEAPMVVALGGLDCVVTYRKAMGRMHEWKSRGIPVNVMTQPFKGHQNMIRWFDSNVLHMFEAAKTTDGLTKE